MTRIMGALFRKEWHEHKVEAVVFSAVLCAFTLAAVFSSGRDIVADFQSASGLFGPIVAMFMGVAAVSRERSERMLEFVCSLPVPRWRVGLVRLLMTVATCAAPIVATAAIVHIVIASGIAVGNVIDLWAAACVSIGCAASLTLWIAAIAVDQPNQTRASLVALFVLASWFGISLLLTGSNHPIGWPRWLIDLVLDVGPGGWWEISTVPVKRPGTGLLVSQVLANATLISLAAMNYGRIVEPTRLFSRKRTRNQSGRLVRHRSPALALWWMQFREMAPLIYAGLILAAVWSICRTTVFRPEPAAATVITGNMTVASVAFGLFWTGLVALATFVPNLQPRLATFWRSRPLSVSRWFWSKAILGLVTSLVCLNLPTLITVSINKSGSAAALRSELAGQLCVVMAQTMAYSVALCAACLIRQSVYAGIISLSASVMILLGPISAGQPKSNASLAFADLGQLLRVDVATHRLVQFAESGGVVSDVNDLAFLPFLALTTCISMGGLYIAWRAVCGNFVRIKG